MAQTQCDLRTTVPVLAYERADGHQDMVWAVRYVGAWIIATAGVALARSVGFRSFHNPLPAAGAIIGVAIGIAVLRRNRWALICAILLAAVAPIADFTPYPWNGMILASSFVRGLLPGLVDAALLYTFLGFAQRFNAFSSSKSTMHSQAPTRSATHLLMQLLGWRFMANAVVAVGPSVPSIVGRGFARMLADQSAILLCYALLVAAGAMMVFRRKWAVLVAGAMSVAIVVAPLAFSSRIFDWALQFSRGLDALATCTLLVILFVRLEREMPSAAAAPVPRSPIDPNPVYIHRGMIRWTLFALALGVVLAGFFDHHKVDPEAYFLWAADTVKKSLLPIIPGLFLLASPIMMVLSWRAHTRSIIRYLPALPLLLIWCFTGPIEVLPLAIGCTLVAGAYCMNPVLLTGDGVHLRHWRIRRGTWKAGVLALRIVLIPLLGPTAWFTIVQFGLPSGMEALGPGLMLLQLFPVFLIVGAVLAWFLTGRLREFRTRTPREWAYRD